VVACLALGACLARVPDAHVSVRVGPLVGAPALSGWTLEPVDVEPRRTALLVHGVTASAETMRVLGESLARAGYRCLLVDAPAHGRSAAGFDFVEAVVRAAAELSDADPPRVDLVVGHSMGGYLLQRALQQGRLRTGYFVSVGARTGVQGLGGTPTLLITGSLDPLATPVMLEALAAAADPGQDVEVVSVPGCDHALEPFHPLLIEAVRARALERLGGAPTPTLGGGVWTLRLLGGLLCLLGGLLAVPMVVPRREAPPSALEAVRLGLAGSAAAWCGAALAIHGVWFYGLPGGKGWVGVPLCTALAGLVSWGAHQLARVARPGLGVSTVHLLGTATLLLGGFGLGLAGQRFPALLLVLVGCGTAIGTGLGAWLARRSGSPLTAHAAFAVCLGYLPGLWVRVFV
jgi:pimeloyl-ACP methyl ester carboxylesterase